MKKVYTKDNIIGIKFAEKYKDANHYKITHIEGNKVWMDYLHQSSCPFNNTVENTLYHLNAGSWKEFSPKPSSSLIIF